jgi:hypothetical protein
MVAAWPTWQVVGATVCIVLAGVLLLAWTWNRACPDLIGVIAFRPASAPQDR